MNRELVARFEVGMLCVTIWSLGPTHTMVSVNDPRIAGTDERIIEGPPPSKPADLADMILTVVRGTP